MIKFRDLKAGEIKVRVDRITAKGAALLLYKDARVDMDILDETVGPGNWQRKHYERKSNMFCSVGININFNVSNAAPEWVWKDDVGIESNASKEKGEASDSFKRACVNWGIGRELYSAPFIFAPCKTTKNEKGKYELADKYALNDMSVSHIKVSDGKITELTIVEKNGNVIYSSAGRSKEPIDPEIRKAVDVNEAISIEQAEALKERVELLGMTVPRVCAKYGVNSMLELTKAQFADCASQLAQYEEKVRRKEKLAGQA